MYTRARLRRRGGHEGAWARLCEQPNRKETKKRMRSTRHARPRINKLAMALVALAISIGVQAAATIYPDVSRAGPDIEAALKQAARTERRVLVDFGGNWCGDCI